MTEALKCPSCSAPLTAPAGSASSMLCPYCNTTVMLSGSNTAPAFLDVSPSFGPAIGKAVQMAEVLALVRAGQKIEAIKLYRRIHGSDLASAKQVIDRMAEGQMTGTGMPINLQSVAGSAASAAASSAKYGCGVATAIFVFVVVLMAFVFSRVHSQMSPHIMPAIQTPSFNIPPIQIPGQPPAAPQFADVVMQFGSEGIGPGQFKDSRTVAVDNTGKIYVSEYGDGRIQIFDPAGKFLSLFTIGKGNYVQGIAVDRQGGFYVCTNGEITRYDLSTHLATNKFQQSTEDNAFSPEEFDDVVAAPNGNIYSVAGSHIIVLNPKGEIQNIFKEADHIGEDVDFFRVAVSGEGDIYCLTRGKGVFKFASDGRFINRFGGGEGSGPGYISNAQGIIVDGQGRVLVSSMMPAIQVFDDTGRFIDSFGGRDVCFGLALDDQQNLYACFRNAYCVKKFAFNKKK